MSTTECTGIFMPVHFLCNGFLRAEKQKFLCSDVFASKNEEFEVVFILKLKFVAVVNSFGTVQKSKEFGQTQTPCLPNFYSI